MEARAALSLGLTRTQWLDLSDEDQAWAIAGQAIPDQKLCGVCGGPADVCQDHDAQNAWVIDARRCYKTKAVNEFMAKRKGDEHAHALHITAHIDPARRKSARATKEG